MVRVSIENIVNQTSKNSTQIKSSFLQKDSNMAGVPIIPVEKTNTSNNDIGVNTTTSLSTGSVSGSVAAIAVVAPTARAQPTQQVQLSQQTAHSGAVSTGGVSPNPLKSSVQQPMKLVQQSHQKPQPNAIYVTASRSFTAPPPPHQHLHTIGPPTTCQTGVGPQWPIVDPVFHFGPGFEHQHYCPTHSQGPQPHEHVVFFHVNPGVSVTFQISGNREIIRGKFIHAIII